MDLIELKNNLLSTDNNDRNELLMLLIQAYYYNEELIQDGFYEILYNKLSSTYKPLTEDKETLKIYAAIKSKKIPIPIDTYSLIMLEQLMVFIKGKEGVSPAIVEKLLEYHNRVNTEFIKNLYTTKIKDCIGKNALAVVENNHRKSIECGELSYDSGITIADKKLIGKVYKIISNNKIVYFYQKINNKKSKIMSIIRNELATAA